MKNENYKSYLGNKEQKAIFWTYSLVLHTQYFCVPGPQPRSRICLICKRTINEICSWKNINYHLGKSTTTTTINAQVTLRGSPQQGSKWVPRVEISTVVSESLLKTCFSPPEKNIFIAKKPSRNYQRIM